MKMKLWQSAVTRSLAKVLIVVMGLLITHYGVAEKPLMVEKGIQYSSKYDAGRVTSFEAEVAESDGGPVTREYEIASASPYPPGAVLEIEASLSVEGGYYEIEFFSKEKPSFTLAAKPNKPVKGKGKVSVTSDGLHLECRVISKAAKNVRYSFKISPAP